jgi:hypothetical protein
MMQDKIKTQYYFIILILYALFTSVLFREAYVDELIALSAVFFLKKLSKPILRILLFLSISILFALLGNFFYEKQVESAIILDFLTFCKFFATLIVGYGLCWRRIIFRFRNEFIKHCKFLLALCLCFALVLQMTGLGNSLASIFQTEITSHQYGYNYVHNISHQMALYAFSIYCFLSFLSEKNQKKIILIPVLVGLVSATTVATVYVVILFFAFTLFIWKRKTIKIVHLLYGVVFVLFLAKDTFVYYFGEDFRSDFSTRASLLYHSFHVASDYFPFGSGLATYGTSSAAKWYSKIYYEYGLDTIHGLTEEAPTFSSDSFYPAIIAETGFIGAICYLIALCLILTQIFKIQNNKHFIIALLVFLIPLFNSIANASFFNILASLPAFLIGMFLYLENELISNISK